MGSVRSNEFKEGKMEVMEVIFDRESFGVTQRSLKVLRDAIAERFRHRLAVVEVPTIGECCGFLIFDEVLQEAVWTGDGFRFDDYGEGGVGYRSAKAIFTLFGIKPLFWEPVDFEEIFHAEEGKVRLGLLAIACSIGEALTPEDFSVPAENNAYYVRHLNVVSNAYRKRKSLNLYHREVSR